MQIILAINCGDFECVKEKFQKAVKLSDWVQIDVADGKFTEHKTWNSPSDLRPTTNPEAGQARYGAGDQRLKLEVHLMVLNPFAVIDDWIKAGAQRVIVHAEAIRDQRLTSKQSPEGEQVPYGASKLATGQATYGLRFCELGIAINPETPVDKLSAYLQSVVGSKEVGLPNIGSKEVGLPNIKFVQLLAVHPGKSGQKFDERVLAKIKFLKKNYPDVIIEVDGGINLETAKLCKEAGADILVAGSYIWESGEPEEAYLRIANI